MSSAIDYKQPFADYHLGTGKGLSIRGLAKMMEKKYKKKCNIAWGALPYRVNDVMYAVAPIGRLIVHANFLRRQHLQYQRQCY